MSKIKLTNQAAPATPSAGKTEVYTDSTTKRLATKDDAGTVVAYGAGGGSGDVVGPAASTDLDIAVFSGVTGKLLAVGAKKIADLIYHSLATAANDFLVSSGAGVFVKKTLAETKTVLGLGSAAYTSSTDYVPHSLATALSDFIVASGAGVFVKKTLAEVKTILSLAALAYKATVATADIDVEAVTYARMQHVSATDKVLGRSTAGTGDVEEIACTAAGRAILDDANAAAQLATLGAMPSADESVTYAKMQHVSATDKVLGRSTAGAGDVEEIACTAAGRAILDDANAATQLATLGAAPTASPTFTGTMTVPKTLEIQDTSADHQYVLAVSELTADRTITLPLLTAADVFVFAAFIQTLTNKRITSRVGTVASHATPTPTADDSDLYTVTAQAEAAAFAAPSGTPTNGQKLIIRIKDNATARALSWDAIYRALGVALPTTTTISKTLYVGFIYNSTDSKWDCIAKTEEA